MHHILNDLPRSLHLPRSLGAQRPLPDMACERVNKRGARLWLEKFDITMNIPPGAIREGIHMVTLTAVQDFSGLGLGNDKSLSCYGIVCEPSNLHFNLPVQVKIPHSAVIVKPADITPDIVCRTTDDTGTASFSRIKSSPQKPPYCVVKEREFHLVIDHCAEWWIVLKLEQDVLQKRIICTPYIPSNVMQGEEYTIKLHIHDDLPGIEEEIQVEEERFSFRRAHRAAAMQTEVQVHELLVSCEKDASCSEQKTLQVGKLGGRLNTTLPFEITPNGQDEKFHFITLTICQGNPHPTSLVICFQCKLIGPAHTTNIADANSHHLQGEQRSVSLDKEIRELAEVITLDQYYDIGVSLGFTINQLDEMEIQRLRNREQATVDMLLRCKQRCPPKNVGRMVLILRSTIEDNASLNPQGSFSEILNNPSGEISNEALIQCARKMRSEDYVRLGTSLGFTTTELDRIQYATLNNRKDANVRMLNRWKMSQSASAETMDTLRRIWQSVQRATERQEDKHLAMVFLND